MYIYIQLHKHTYIILYMYIESSKGCTIHFCNFIVAISSVEAVQSVCHTGLDNDLLFGRNIFISKAPLPRRYRTNNGMNCILSFFAPMRIRSLQLQGWWTF